MVLDGEYEAFAAEVGVQTGDEGTAVFVVTVDGERRFESGEMKGGDAAKKMHVSLVGARQMTLTAASGVGPIGRTRDSSGPRGPLPPPRRTWRHSRVW